MPQSLCIHGHFYQPPRENPWLGLIPVEASAAPMRHWNERILRESYAPLAWARRLDSNGKISDILNCYAWMSFNAGPTLLQWMRRDAPEVLARMREGDAESRARWGHGNAMAQIYHHIIMPLADEEDRALEVSWAIDDFRYHFGRDPEGMWLSECAADLPTLDSLAAQGISFVILAPRQARAVIADGVRRPVDTNSLRTGEPYSVILPSGRSITVVFYDGRLSQSIAFEGLLRDGEAFWQRIAGAGRSLAGPYGDSGLVTIATDGETYGHHFTFGEMALAYALSQGYAMRDNIRLTNLAAYIAAHPPQHRVEIHEPSSWSCVHGVERWRSDCGCTDGGHPHWNQAWRGPLRLALDRMRTAVRRQYALAGADCLRDPDAALLDYGRVLADPASAPDFAARWFTGGNAEHDRAWKLLAMREQALAAYASCAWFFDDIGRIEPENAMTFALRALDLLRETGGPDQSGDMMAELDKARSNQPGYGTGKDIFMRRVLPRHEDAASLTLLAWTLLQSEGRPPLADTPVCYDWPAVSVEFTPPPGEEEAALDQAPHEPAQPGPQSCTFGAASPLCGGTAAIRTRLETRGSRYIWNLSPCSTTRLSGQAFVPLADMTMIAWPEAAAAAQPDASAAAQPDASAAAQPAARPDASAAAQSAASAAAQPDGEVRRNVRGLAQPMSDDLLTRCLENREKRLRPNFRADAAHALSLFQPWSEAQHDMPRPEFWNGLQPYMILEAMSDGVSDEVRNILAVFLEGRLSEAEKALTRRLVSDELLAALDDAESHAVPGGDSRPVHAAAPWGEDIWRLDARLAVQVRRVRALVPDMDWWTVQNRVWERGLRLFPSLAEELGFRRAP